VRLGDSESLLCTVYFSCLRERAWKIRPACPDQLLRPITTLAADSGFHGYEIEVVDVGST